MQPHLAPLMVVVDIVEVVIVAAIHLLAVVAAVEAPIVAAEVVTPPAEATIQVAQIVGALGVCSVATTNQLRGRLLVRAS